MLISLWKLTGVVYTFILIVSELNHQLFGCSRWAILLAYGFGMISFYTWHLSAHKRIKMWPFCSVYAAHMDHHWHIYPPTAEKFLSEKPLHSKAGIAARPPWVPRWLPDCEHELVLVLMIAVNQFVLGPLLLGASFRESLSGFLFCMFSGMVMVYTHESTHIKGHWAEKYTWFQDLRALHLMHHRGSINMNYGMYSFLTDAIFGTYEDPSGNQSALSPSSDHVHPMERDSTNHSTSTSTTTTSTTFNPLTLTVFNFTGKKAYQFGDISKELYRRFQMVQWHDLLPKFALGL